jgi:hypothetical protein
MIGNRICAIALAGASATVCSIPSAIAEPFDGNWGVVAQTTQGHCGSMQFALAINRADSTLAVDITSSVTRRSWVAASPPPGMCKQTEWLARAPCMPPDASSGFRAAGLGPVVGRQVSAQASGMPLL